MFYLLSWRRVDGTERVVDGELTGSSTLSPSWGSRLGYWCTFSIHHCVFHSEAAHVRVSSSSTEKTLLVACNFWLTRLKETWRTWFYSCCWFVPFMVSALNQFNSKSRRTAVRHSQQRCVLVPRYARWCYCDFYLIVCRSTCPTNRVTLCIFLLYDKWRSCILTLLM